MAVSGRLICADVLLQWGHGREAMDGTRPVGSWLAPRYFNGAMAVRPWMAAWPYSAASRAAYFNGAMAVRPWMDRSSPRFLQWSRLQWGHGREAMDGEFRADYSGPAIELQWGHGREAMDG